MRGSQRLLPGQTFEAAKLLPPAQAILAYGARVALAPLGIEKVALQAAYGRILAEPIRADAPYPAQPRSTMDGFAVRSADGVAPRRIAGEVRMGEAPPRDIGAGETLRIPTGGVLPNGADAVVPIEDVDLDEDSGVVVPHEPPRAGDSFTPAADDMREGELVLAPGRRIDPAACGVLATLGIVDVPVYRRPRVAVISTGDELVPPSTRLGPGQVRDSNRYGIAAALEALGAAPIHLPRAADDVGVLESALREALAIADAVILSGGSSVGVRDLVPRVVDHVGDPGVVVHGLRVKPGKPTILGAIGTTPVIGLPGNPTSALMIFRTVAAPILRALTGETARRTAPALARAGATIEGRAGWTWFVPVQLAADGLERIALPLRIRSSHTSLLARADGFVVVPEDRASIREGEHIEVHGFDGVES